MKLKTLPTVPLQVKSAHGGDPETVVAFVLSVDFITGSMIVGYRTDSTTGGYRTDSTTGGYRTDSTALKTIKVPYDDFIEKHWLLNGIFNPVPK